MPNNNFQQQRDPHSVRPFISNPLPPAGDNNSGKTRWIFLGLGIGLAVCLLVVGVFLFLSGNNDNSSSKLMSLDDITNNSKRSETGYDPEYNTYSQAEYEDDGLSESSSAMSTSGEEYADEVGVVTAPTESRRLNGSSVAESRIYSFSGSVDGYPIKMWITCYSNGSVKGKYCYNSTIEKYGNSPSSYFYLTGHATDNGSCLQLISREYKKEQPFERIEIRVDGSDVYAELMSVNSGRSHSLYLRRTDY